MKRHGKKWKGIIDALIPCTFPGMILSYRHLEDKLVPEFFIGEGCMERGGARREVWRTFRDWGCGER